MRTLYIWLKRPLVLILLIVLIFFVFKQLHFFDGLFISKPLLIDNTPLVIKEVRAIAELNTATLYEEIVVDSIAPSAFLFAAKREIVLVIKGKVTAGVDLTDFNDNNVFVKDDSVSVLLPSAVIREAIINPSDVETFYEFGKWNNEEITRLKISARSKMLEAAARKDLTGKADLKARSVMEDFLRVAGFNQIHVETKPD